MCSDWLPAHKGTALTIKISVSNVMDQWRSSGKSRSQQRGTLTGEVRDALLTGKMSIKTK